MFFLETNTFVVYKWIYWKEYSKISYMTKNKVLVSFSQNSSYYPWFYETISNHDFTTEYKCIFNLN